MAQGLGMVGTQYIFENSPSLVHHLDASLFVLRMSVLQCVSQTNAGEVSGPKALVGAWSVPNFGKGDENQDT